MGSAILTYSIHAGVLSGIVAGKFVHVIAKSGGGGSSTRGASDPDAVNNPYRTGQRTDKAAGVRGGPIPPGRYTIKPPAPWHKSRAARLEPTSPGTLRRRTGRDGGFLIHGPGPLGSDGCIVPVRVAGFSQAHGWPRRRPRRRIDCP